MKIGGDVTGFKLPAFKNRRKMQPEQRNSGCERRNSGQKRRLSCEESSDQILDKYRPKHVDDSDQKINASDVVVRSCDASVTSGRGATGLDITWKIR